MGLTHRLPVWITYGTRSNVNRIGLKGIISRFVLAWCCQGCLVLIIAR